MLSQAHRFFREEGHSACLRDAVESSAVEVEASCKMLSINDSFQWREVVVIGAMVRMSLVGCEGNENFAETRCMDEPYGDEYFSEV